MTRSVRKMALFSNAHSQLRVQILSMEGTAGGTYVVPIR